jgi:hypothetical protein
MDLEETEVRNDSAGEASGNHPTDRPTDRPPAWVSEESVRQGLESNSTSEWLSEREWEPAELLRIGVGVTNISQNPPVVEEERTISKHIKVGEEQKYGHGS